MTTVKVITKSEVALGTLWVEISSREAGVGFHVSVSLLGLETIILCSYPYKAI